MENIVAGLELFQKGGLVMYVLLLCSLFVMAIGLERFQYFRRMDSGRGFARSFAELMGADDYAGAMRLAQESSGNMAEIVVQAAERATGGQEVSSFMEIQSGVALARFRRRLYYLNVIVTMAPLLGLLGTISGMISAFSVFNVQSAQAAAITGGVGEALIATAFGLCVAIMALAVHAFFVQWVENIVTDMEQVFSLVEARQAELIKAGAAYAFA
ncbi:MotA/TolQ/ExbB proton channel family protein [Selenomonas ruminantium]|uniref:Biopolymer transport protein ExbB n=1 Tax=Selenomonas ruminantium TaxID=971 RepID=A0A1H0S9P2_SELRU|nr:MotA/TolQ/ExbB proton channel family protein [Selenomonas ruminantium]SDP38512.1 biopolymer transport protein ExbB [Selenomonas ruminantium]